MVALLIAFPGLVRHDKVPAPRDPAAAPIAAPAPAGAPVERGFSLPPYPPAIPGAPAPEHSGPGAPTLDMSVPPVIVPPRQ